ncbi:hypothetical protein V6N11_009855 [Hibiscus sabdariffa]|uniref:Calcineurin B-like protein n=1 Tax=Hibiscus sabdariffa TaxID=183260 RepID=A0ABR1ZXJ1_9ROSI
MLSPNRFDLLCTVVGEQENDVVSPRKGRVAAGGVAELMQQLKPKEEFQLGVFRNSSNQNLFADRLFDLFDAKHNGAIEFGDFVRSLSVFHPGAPASDKTEFLFRLYDLRQSGYISLEEVKALTGIQDCSSGFPF